MAENDRIRLGGIEASYGARHGLMIHDVHDHRVTLHVCEADLPKLVRFICRHNPASKDAVKLSPPHWKHSRSEQTDGPQDQ